MKFIVENKKIIILLVILFVCVSCKYNDINVETPIGPSKDEIINSVIEYDSSLDSAFLSYVYDEYGKMVLIDILGYMEDNSYNSKIWHNVTGLSLNVLYDYYNNVYDNNENVKIIGVDGDINLSFVGDVSLADDWEIMPYYDSRKMGIYGILGEDVVKVMKNADIMIANNEFTISDRGRRMPNKYYTFRAFPERLSIYEEMGVDIVSLANNHVYDYGEEAFFDMLGHLKEYDIPYVGAGVNRDEATSPYYFIANGYKIAFVAATRAEKYILTPEATDDSSGVFRAYDPTLLLKTISEVKKTSDYVIVLMHWGREDSHELEEVQIDTGKMYIDAGADLLVGSHAHVLQGMEFYNGKLISYNLGDFIFNRETKDTGILSININDAGNMSYEFIPCFQNNFKTTLLSGNDKLRVINDMRNYSINTTFDDSGKFYVAN